MRLAAAVLLALTLAGCSAEKSEPAAAETAFAGALGTVEVVEPVGTGVGWIDVDAVAAAPGSDRRALEAIAGALGPGGDDFLAEARPGLARLGFDPGNASQIVSLNGSYTFGLRVDGVSTRRLGSELGAPAAEAGDWDLYDLAEFGTAPQGRLGRLTSATGAYVALSERAAAFARSAGNRSNLFEVEEPAAQADVLKFAAECLGEVSAARVLPNNFNYLPKLGPRFAALGVRPLARQQVEVLCGIEESSEDIEAYAAELQERLAPGALEPTLGKRMGALIDDVEIDTVEGDGYHAARAVVTLAEREEPGFVFRSFNRGSLVTFFGFQDPTSGVEAP
ncbi:MAG: hypothetical protein M3Y34_07100 [Actinomycetota bacterium]|nr:hypothetical protein [Actinomycetota bacterium]